VPAYRKLPSGKHNYEVRLPNGRRKSFTDPIKGVAKRRAEEFERAIRDGQPVTVNRKATVADWHAKWVATRTVEPATAAKNASHWRTHIAPRWGDWPLSLIGRSDVQSWVRDMTHAGSGAATVTAVYHLFSALLRDAVLEGVLAVSPCREIDLPKIVKPAPRWLTEEEYGRIQLALAVTPRAPVWQAYVGLGCYSGLRPGELAGLDVGDVDLSRNLVHVHQVMTRHGMRAYGKTNGSTRWVPFPPQVADLLWPVIGDRGSGAVFTSARGDRVRDELFRDRVWQPALEAAGVEYVRPYVLRHTAASWLVQAGVPPFEVVKMLGHNSMALVNTYLHLAPDQHDRIRAAWGGARAGQVPHGENEKSPSPSGLGL